MNPRMCQILPPNFDETTCFRPLPHPNMQAACHRHVDWVVLELNGGQHGSHGGRAWVEPAGAPSRLGRSRCALRPPKEVASRSAQETH